jgi:sarcosine oxidase
LEEKASCQLLYQTGLLYMGRKEESLLSSIRKSAEIYDVELQDIDIQEARQNYPQFRLKEGYETVLEPDAGFVTPEKTILTLVKLAILHGAKIKTRSQVQSWVKRGDHLEVRTRDNTYKAKQIVLCSGAFTGKIVPELRQHLKVTQQLITWTSPRSWDMFEFGSFPCWVMTKDGLPGIFYGFPILPVHEFMGPVGLKIAHHHGGQLMDDPMDNQVFEESEELVKIRSFLEEHIPDALDDFISVKSCLYTYSPDEHFMIDFLPGYDGKVVIASGFSGHGFKFVPIIGEILADLTLKGASDHPIGFLSMNRF